MQYRFLIQNAGSTFLTSRSYSFTEGRKGEALQTFQQKHHQRRCSWLSARQDCLCLGASEWLRGSSEAQGAFLRYPQSFRELSPANEHAPGQDGRLNKGRKTPKQPISRKTLKIKNLDIMSLVFGKPQTKAECVYVACFLPGSFL